MCIHDCNNYTSKIHALMVVLDLFYYRPSPSFLKLFSSLVSKTLSRFRYSHSLFSFLSLLTTGCQESSRSIFKFNVIQKLQ